MMTAQQQELKQTFDRQYSMMAASKNPKNMMLFGEVMQDMMDWLIDNKPALAQQCIEKLEAMNWKQYLTRDEAQDIVDNMNPPAPWDYPTWENAMQSLGLEMERDTIFNRYALWAEMNAKYSDNAKTLADMVWQMPLREIPADKLVPVIHALAIDALTDKDGKFNVRKYFLTK